MARNLLLFVGTLNRETPYFQGARGNGLRVLSLDEATLEARDLAGWPHVENPTFLSVTPNGARIYANSEVAEWREGLVTALAFDRAAGRLEYLNCQPTLGSIAAHNVLSRDGRRLFVVNYTVGEGGPDQSLAMFDLLPDGRLSPATASAAHRGRGPDPQRQERAHAHSLAEMPGGLLVVADLGCDRLVSYRATGNGLQRIAETATAPGAGPRHMATFGHLVFTVNELDSTVTAHRLDPGTGALAPIDVQPTVPEQARSGNHCSDIAVTGDGRFLYAGNRGHDSVAVFAVEGTGHLRPCGTVPSGGRTPRNLALTPSGRHLLVANQNSDRISILARDAGTGALTDTGQGIAIGTPMCLKFAA
ncbi:lactonase family protein [Paracoccus shandongensis]|uniref:lactonase family protein n=1 Tax=Paracoccus shandongensis TaxID=2816048 RepID=UPI001A8EADE1|nr:lactonase family protein [Paracoccus shandongensis]